MYGIKLTFFSSSLAVSTQISLQLPRTAFDFQKPALGYADDEDVIAHFPCRILADWFICKKLTPYSRSHYPRKRTALPRHINHLDNYVLYGTIKPNHPQQEPLKVELTNLVHYTIDHSREFRGYWIATEEANYWLQQPCTKRLSVDSCTITVAMTHEGMRGEFPRHQIELPSQQELHVFHRAQLGLFSNLVDLMFPPIATASDDDDDSRDFYVHYFSKQTPQQIFEELSPSPDLMKFYQEKKKRLDPSSEPLAPLHEHPFDLSLLLSPCSMEFLYPHIRHLHMIQLNESTFLKALEGNVKPIDDEYEYESQQLPSYLLSTSIEETCWRLSAEEAERRSQQTPWGQPIPGSQQQQPKLVSSMELGLEYIVSKLGAPDSSNGAERQESSRVHSDSTLLSTTVISNQQTSNLTNGQPTQCEGDDLVVQPILSHPCSKRQRGEPHDSVLCDSGCESDVNERRQRPKTTHGHEKVASNNIVSTDASEGEEDESGFRNSTTNIKKAIANRSSPETLRLSASANERQDPEPAQAVDRHIMEVSEPRILLRIPRRKRDRPVEQQSFAKTQLSSKPTLAPPDALAELGFENVERVSKSQGKDERPNYLGNYEGFPSQEFAPHPKRVSETETLQSYQQDQKSLLSKYIERPESAVERNYYKNDSNFRRPTFDANRSNNYDERRRQPSSNNSERSRRDSGHRQYSHGQHEEMECSYAAHGNSSSINRRRESECGPYSLSLNYEKRNTPNPGHQPQPQRHVGGREERQPGRPSTHRDESFSRNHSLEPPFSFQRHQQNPGSARGFKNEPIPGDERELRSDRGYPRFDSERTPRPPLSRHVTDYHDNFEPPSKQINSDRRPSRHTRDHHENFEQFPRSRIELQNQNVEGFRDRQGPTSSHQSLDHSRRDSWHQCYNRGDFEPRQFAREASFTQRDDSRGIAKKLGTRMISSERTRVEGRVVSVEQHHQNTRRQSDRQTSPSPCDSRPGAFSTMNGRPRDPRLAHKQGH